MTPTSSFDTSSLEAFLRCMLATRYFVGDNPPLLAHYTVGSSPLVVITGQNAFGKSFFRRMIQSAGRKAEFRTIATSMEGRASSGIVRALMCGGSEEEDATGALSTNLLLGGFKTSRSWDCRHTLFMDEPDIGLGEEYQVDVGHRIADFIQDPPKFLFGAFVVSHSRTLMRPLLATSPHHIHIGLDCPASLQAWVDRSIVRRSIDEIGPRAREIYQRLSAVIPTPK